MLCGPGRSPCGERGLKCAVDGSVGDLRGRSPCGERGLKWKNAAKYGIDSRSLPVRGAWVEISYYIADAYKLHVAPRAGSVG